MPADATVPIDFARDNRWLTQIQEGDVLTEAENLALWRDLLACFYLAQTFEAALAAADQRLDALQAENLRLRTALEAKKE